MKHTEVVCRFVYFDLDVKSWAGALPGVREARPARCPCCEAPGIEPDGEVVLHGHGLRRRQGWGPPKAGAAVELGVLVQRRYRCTRCRTVIVVRPRGVLSRYRYTAAAIALALWIWSAERRPDATVRAATCPRPATGVSRPERWTTLRRWARAARDGRVWSCASAEATWTLRQCAERAARIVAAFADTEIVDERIRAFAGAAHAR